MTVGVWLQEPEGEYHECDKHDISVAALALHKSRLNS